MVVRHNAFRSRALTGGYLLVLSLTFAVADAAAEKVRGALTLVGAPDRPAKKMDSAGAVVWLEPVATGTRRTLAPPKPAVVTQRNTMFAPRLLAIEVGTAVDFPNNDSIVHNVFSNHDGQVFDLQLYAPRTERRVVFRRPGIVRVFCNIHETMSAVIAVLPTPYFAVTDASGRFEIEAPAGDYRVQFWHERAQGEALAKLARQVTVREADTLLPETQIVLSNQPLSPHKDKYGREYAQRPYERPFYLGIRR